MMLNRSCFVLYQFRPLSLFCLGENEGLTCFCFIFCSSLSISFVFSCITAWHYIHYLTSSIISFSFAAATAFLALALFPHAFFSLYIRIIHSSFFSLYLSKKYVSFRFIMLFLFLLYGSFSLSLYI
ncbi:hypothetical protein BDB00DRAFT_797560 [Zychaea mexicana]|uniref:uncharacterized protein n=1 Tax=Zychaea mexicana TaxID=64656 RepID=UPI0022FEAD42|nr:uncharacterized protein BDB00DRAFT_797560 [Zychaea mexicana]KAI9498959.1 hypothetical protein BDB00DRAFT_797560 [Zychaea mexicana]